MRNSKKFGVVLAIMPLAAVALMYCGCAVTSEKAKPCALTENIGIYTPPPTNMWRAQVGVPAFQVGSTCQDSSKMESKRMLANVAADQLTTLAIKSGRFKVYERAQLDKLLAEQRLTNIVSEGTLATPGRIRGVDYLLLGQVTSFRVKAENSSGGVAGFGGLFRHFGPSGVPDFDIKSKNSKITVECGVDLRLVDPQTGRAMAAESGDFQKTDKVNAMGISVEGVRAESDGELTIKEDDYGKILRLALDSALRKMLPSIDQEFLAHVETPSHPSGAGSVSAHSGSLPVAPAENPLMRFWRRLITW
jgi:curli biogenesis system outer membrane secretion channel CsgG